MHQDTQNCTKYIKIISRKYAPNLLRKHMTLPCVILKINSCPPPLQILRVECG